MFFFSSFVVVVVLFMWHQMNSKYVPHDESVSHCDFLIRCVRIHRSRHRSGFILFLFDTLSVFDAHFAICRNRFFFCPSFRHFVIFATMFIQTYSRDNQKRSFFSIQKSWRCLPVVAYHWLYSSDPLLCFLLGAVFCLRAKWGHAYLRGGVVYFSQP